MLRQTWYWEVEVVRIQDGEQTAPARRLDFSVRPLNYLLGGLAAGGLAAALLMAFVLTSPGDYSPHRYSSYCTFDPGYDIESGGTFCCGVPARNADVVTPLRREGDSTLLVRRLP